MIKLFTSYSLIFIFALSLLACSDIEKQNKTSNQVTLYDKKGNQIGQIKDQEAVEKIAKIIATKKVTLLKMLPLFETKLAIKSAKETSEWWIVSRYIKSATQTNAPLMEIDFEGDLLDLVKSLSE